MKQYLYISAAFLLLQLQLTSGAIAATIQYGKVTSVSMTTIEDDDGPSGAVKGGLLGAAIGPRRPGINPGIIAGAAIGAAADAGDTETLYLYTVEYIDGSGAIRINTEQGDIRDGDCVSIEQGQHTNIRRISSVHCEQKTATPPAHHARSAKECDLAKQELVTAETDKALDIAIRKVRVLCED